MKTLVKPGRSATIPNHDGKNTKYFPKTISEEKNLLNPRPLTNQLASQKTKPSYERCPRAYPLHRERGQQNNHRGQTDFDPRVFKRL